MASVIAAYGHRFRSGRTTPFDEAQPASSFDDFAGGLGDADGTAELQSFTAGDPGADAVAEEDEGIDGAVGAVFPGGEEAFAEFDRVEAVVGDGDAGGALRDGDESAGGEVDEVDVGGFEDVGSAEAEVAGDAMLISIT